jgi:hypothetical protein
MVAQFMELAGTVGIPTALCLWFMWLVGKTIIPDIRKTQGILVRRTSQANRALEEIAEILRDLADASVSEQRLDEITSRVERIRSLLARE